MFWLLRTVTADVTPPNVCRLWLIEGENLEETLEHFRSNVRYMSMKMNVLSEHDGVVSDVFHQVTSRIRELS
jgi:hypothetical protein